MTDSRDDPGYVAAAVGTAVFTLLVPGTVVGVVPYALTGWKSRPPLLGAPITRWLGLLLFLAAVPMFGDFLVRFVRQGAGTPAPVAPPRHLVTGGPFRCVRNPAYVSVVAMVAAQGLWFASPPVLIYSAGLAIAFHLYVVFFEEPGLRARFGDTYEAYCREVPRWIPRFRCGPSRGTASGGR